MSTVEQLPSYATRLKADILALESTIQPLVEGLDSIPAFNGAALFVPDRWHNRSAGTVALVHRPDLSSERRDFTDTNIKNHRIDTTATAVGDTFASHESNLTPSRMNPDTHMVWGAYMSPGQNQSAVLQLAFDRSIHAMPSERSLQDTWEHYEGSITDAAAALIATSLERTSLANDLLLDTPITPNAFVVKWDVTQSTRMVSQDYPTFRNYLQELQSVISASIDQFSGRIVAYSGDGQNIVVDIPHDVDRADLAAVGQFGQRTATPLMQIIVEAHKSVAPRYATLRPNIRVGLDLGHVELSEMGEETGSTFWDVAETVESLPRNKTSYAITRVARLAFWLARQNK